MTPGSIVTLRDGGGREGRIVKVSHESGCDWLVAWHDTNLRSHEPAAALRFASAPATVPIERRPPARVAIAICFHGPARKVRTA